MSLDEIQQKKQIIESRARIREFVFGIQDGLISTVGLLAGVQGATENNVVVIITGLTAMISGALSMGAGSYLSSAAQKEIFDREIAEDFRAATQCSAGRARSAGQFRLDATWRARPAEGALARRALWGRTAAARLCGRRAVLAEAH